MLEFISRQQSFLLIVIVLFVDAPYWHCYYE